jgi:hypothetical protein
VTGTAPFAGAALTLVPVAVALGVEPGRLLDGLVALAETALAADDREA